MTCRPGLGTAVAKQKKVAAEARARREAEAAAAASVRLVVRVLGCDHLCPDEGGYTTSDPYVQLAVLDTAAARPTGKWPARTTAVMKELNPRWTEENAFTFSAPLDRAGAPRAKLHLRVMEYDRLGSDDFLGELEIDLARPLPAGTAHRTAVPVALALLDPSGKVGKKGVEARRKMAAAGEWGDYRDEGYGKVLLELELLPPEDLPPEAQRAPVAGGVTGSLTLTLDDPADPGAALRVEGVYTEEETSTAATHIQAQVRRHQAAAHARRPMTPVNLSDTRTPGDFEKTWSESTPVSAHLTPVRLPEEHDASVSAVEGSSRWKPDRRSFSTTQPFRAPGLGETSPPTKFGDLPKLDQATDMSHMPTPQYPPMRLQSPMQLPTGDRAASPLATLADIRATLGPPSSPTLGGSASPPPEVAGLGAGAIADPEEEEEEGAWAVKSLVGLPGVTGSTDGRLADGRFYNPTAVAYAPSAKFIDAPPCTSY